MAVMRAQLLALLNLRRVPHGRLANLMGATGTSIVVRLSAFLLFCIGIQILWNGTAELLGTLPLGAAGSS
jgi:multiple antibiotic resistance protein